MSGRNWWVIILAGWVAVIIASSFYGDPRSGSGKSNYDPADRLPANLYLDWWTYPVRCNLPVGCYEVNTVWTIEAPNVPAMAVRSVSNEFCIKPRT